MLVLVTGSAGMIGSCLVQKLLVCGHKVIGIDNKNIAFNGEYEHICIDLGNNELLEKVFIEKRIERVIHLAALAHSSKGKKYRRSLYEYLNVECSKNVIDLSSKYGIPLLFISTVDVYGFQKSIVNEKTKCVPVTIYGKTKYKAEQYLINSECRYTIFRLSPVYSRDIKRDIQKRYYLKYPNLAYIIGNGTNYEVLNINSAIDEMIKWCYQKVNNEIRILKDVKMLNTKEAIAIEKSLGRANRVLRIPRWVVCFGYYCLRITGKNKYTYLLSKAVNPLRSE